MLSLKIKRRPEVRRFHDSKLDSEILFLGQRALSIYKRQCGSEDIVKRMSGKVIAIDTARGAKPRAIAKYQEVVKTAQESLTQEKSAERKETHRLHEARLNWNG